MMPESSRFTKDWLNSRCAEEVSKCNAAMDAVESLDEQMQASLPFGAMCAKKFMEDNPSDVRNAQASVAQDKKDIMAAIEDKVDDVNSKVTEMRAKSMARMMLAALD
eukprot:gnl/TRDRNA2_/TRDRNA2_156341_c2_seq1.p1 gnl/TRDRNA2_/TRDRNA2_156341_c2~~gnl/TRDRNA2_/TRDRNA2_156341_c2_seq1.p1  ORF type:complete len:115 (+),score=39.13 gnl/TRDRNA2_/TRDRNA2_156341_c2_seq1:26-346(+)